MAWEWLHSLPSLAKFALGMAIIVGIPPLSRRARLPAVVGLLLSGVVIGPHVLGFFGERSPIADFFAELGKLLLMFFAGLAVNAAVRDKPAKEKLEFFGNSFFIPIFFIVTGFLIDPVVFFRSITTNFPLVSAVIGALLVGKWIAAQTVGRAFAYTPAARMTMWSLTLPQVAATLAATLVAFDTRNPAGQRLVDSRLLNVVLVLMVTTSILGPVLREHFAPRLLKEAMPPDRMKAPGTP
jgi:Kef-type K+ transport system membrane component KefB